MLGRRGRGRPRHTTYTTPLRRICLSSRLDAISCSAADVGQRAAGCRILCKTSYVQRLAAASVVASDVIARVKIRKTEIEQIDAKCKVPGNRISAPQVETGMTYQLNSISVS